MESEKERWKDITHGRINNVSSFAASYRFFSFFSLICLAIFSHSHTILHYFQSRACGKTKILAIYDCNRAEKELNQTNKKGSEVLCLVIIAIVSGVCKGRKLRQSNRWIALCDCTSVWYSERS